MRKMMLFLLVTVVWLSLGNTVALADGMLLPLPEGLSPDYLAVRYHHVAVRIEDGHAVTRVEQEFYNPHDIPSAGRYLFPVPPDAILSHFEATVDGERQRVIRQDPVATNEALYPIILQQHDPSLLQYADWESLAFDLSLPPGGSRVMSLEFEEVLAPSGGLYRYRYVLSTERYSSLPLEEVSVTVDLRLSSGLASLYSSSHDVEVERLGPGRARVSWEAQNVIPTEDLQLFFASAEGGFGGGLLTGERNGQDHLLFLFSPETEPRQSATLPKDIVFVMDRSGSMNGEKIEQARNALNYILGQLDGDDRFSIVSFDHRVSVLDGVLLPVTKQTRKDGRRYVDRLTADGNTDLESALQTGLKVLERSEHRGASRMVVFLTDGLPTAGITDGTLIARLVTEANERLEARLHVFGVGYDVNTHLLDRLAGDNGGAVTYVQPGESVELALTGFYDKIAQPVLTDVEVEFEGLEVTELYPENPPDLFQGSSLLMAGRYRVTAGDGQVAVRVRGRAGDEWREHVYRFDLDETGGHDFVPRLWATRRVGALLDRVRVEGESQALAEEIRELGLGYGIVTPYTTSVIKGQSKGAASSTNMALYDLAEVNQATGQVTIQARVQNQAYQQAAQADTAVGANVVNHGQQSLAQVGVQQVDLSLLRGHQGVDEPITGEWIEDHIKVDRTVEFGSKEYFALAADPEARSFLQGGSNVVFSHEGEVIAVRDPEQPAHDAASEKTPEDIQPLIPQSEKQAPRPSGLALSGVMGLLGLLVGLLPFVAVVIVAGLTGLIAVTRCATRPRLE